MIEIFSFNFSPARPKFEKKTIKEILRLKEQIYNSNDKEEIEALERQMKYCELLRWKDYKLFFSQ